jgi:hypothetical protein
MPELVHGEPKVKPRTARKKTLPKKSGGTVTA